MMYRIQHLWILLLLLGTFEQGLCQSDPFTVISYNIWNGYDFGKDEARRAKVQNWINAQSPSLVALQELCAYTPEKLAEDAKSWGHAYSVLLKTSGYSVGLTSTSPIILREKIREEMHHGALHCQTHGMDVFVIHFSPSSYAKRREEIAIILEKVTEAAKDNDQYLVLGDFNAHSPMDADLYDPEGPLLTRLRQSNADKPMTGNLTHGHLDFAVISSALAFPLVDVCQAYTHGISERGSFPGRILGTVNQESEQALIARMQRIDFILTSEQLASKCVNAKVCNGPDNHNLSDHYPVQASFDLSQ